MYPIIIKNKWKQYQKKCKKSKQKEYIMFCAPLHGNLGDHAILYAEEKLLNTLNIKIFEVPTYLEEYYFPVLTKLPEETVIMITGGGFMGSHWFIEEELIRKVIQTYPNNKIIVFPQSIFYEENEFGKQEYENSKRIYNQHQNLFLCAREEISYAIMKQAYPKATILFVPDVVLSLPIIEKKTKSRNSLLLCIRNDKESKLSQIEKENIIKIAGLHQKEIIYTDTVIHKNIQKKDREKELNKKLLEFKQADLVITDRLHGMIFAAITQTPCIVLGNYNHKVKGVYKWLEGLPHIQYVDKIEEIEKEIQRLLNLDKQKWDWRLEKAFQPLIDLIKE